MQDEQLPIFPEQVLQAIQILGNGAKLNNNYEQLNDAANPIKQRSTYNQCCSIPPSCVFACAVTIGPYQRVFFFFFCDERNYPVKTNYEKMHTISK